jgi:hypothetical protein
MIQLLIVVMCQNPAGKGNENTLAWHITSGKSVSLRNQMLILLRLNQEFIGLLN